MSTIREFSFIFLLLLPYLIQFIIAPESDFYILEKAFSSIEYNMIMLLLISITELIKASPHLKKGNLEPSLIFAGSFLVMILIGTALLLLPNMTTNGISFVDALFTATSAVCVTGLIVVDTATAFTFSGKFVILILFQAGGLGILTFTSFFSYFFRGGFSYENQIFMREMLNETKIGKILRTLFKIIGFTLFIELLGTLLIYWVADLSVLDTNRDKIFFAVFHSVSAFCNAGFSTLSNGLSEEGINVQYNLHLIVAILIIIGGLGFPIILNFSKFLKYYLFSRLKHVIEHIPVEHHPRIINVNTRLALVSTFGLIIFGFFMYLLLEQNHTLNNLSTYGKIVTAFFGAVTPRTAGFNTVNMENLALTTILIYLFLMWIGASPGSTGGGIKTTTFSLALVNIVSLGKAKNRVEIFNRELSEDSIRRALAVIYLSFLTIGLAIFLLTLSEPEEDIVDIAFECFSAFSTVGLSLGITSELSIAGKIVITITMFVGRVGILTLILGLIKDVKSINYRYPSENIFIN